MAETWLHFDSGPGAPAANMAWDEALLENAPAAGHPLLRFYGWTEPAGTFGYSQRYAEVAAVTPLRPLIRRSTGGGLVPHARDWTYSFAVPPAHAWYALKAEASYEAIHAWLRDAFALLGIAATLSPCCVKEIPGQCFLGAEKYDLLWHGRKIAGAAQRRTKHGLLIQGSVQPPPAAPERAAWQQAMQAVATREWQVAWEDFAPDNALVQTVAALTDGKFSRDDFNRKR